MALAPPTPGLRPFVNKSNHAAKVSLVVPVGEALSVSDAVARQLGPDFAEVAPPAAPKADPPKVKPKK